jgi:flavodoxin
MAKSLVVCYSRSGTTLSVAQEISAALGADLDPIEDGSNRKTLFGYLHSGFEAASRGLPSVRTAKNPRDYEFVVLGTPVWMGTMSSPVRSYLFLHHGRLPRVAMFATMGGRGGEDALREMKLLCESPEAASAAFVESEIKAGRHRQQLEQFVAGLKRTAAIASRASAA